MPMGLQLSRLEHTPDKREVGGSSPLGPTIQNGSEEINKGYLFKSVLKGTEGTLKTEQQV